MTYPAEWATMRYEELALHFECPLCHVASGEMCETLQGQKRNHHRERWNVAVSVQYAIRAAEGLRILDSL